MKMTEQGSLEAAQDATANKATPLSLAGSLLGLAGVLLSAMFSLAEHAERPLNGLVMVAAIICAFGGAMTLFARKRSVVFGLMCFGICVCDIMHLLHS